MVRFTRPIRVMLGDTDISQFCTGVTAGSDRIDASTYVEVQIPPEQVSPLARHLMNRAVQVDQVQTEREFARPAFGAIPPSVPSDDTGHVRLTPGQNVANSAQAARNAAQAFEDYMNRSLRRVRDEVAAEDGYVRWRGSGDAMTGSSTHKFVQDESQLPAKLCFHCDMWPQHHNHDRMGSEVSLGPCCCQECDPDGDYERDTSIYTE